MNAKRFLSSWSLKELLNSEPDSFEQSKLKILFTLLVMSILKALIVIPFAVYYDQSFQLSRALIALAAYGMMLKVILADRSSLRWIIHIMVALGLLIIFTNTFVTVKRVNIISIQFVFMIILSGFYFVGRTWGIIYSILSIIPILGFMTLSNFSQLHIDRFSAEELNPTGAYIITVLNFVTLILAHYLYNQAFTNNMREKEVLNLQLQSAADSARQLAQSRSDFLSTMSHELRTPLNSVIGMTNLLLDDPHDKEQKENLQILHFSANNLHSLINDILDFNKMESDKLHLELIRVNLAELMHKVVSGLELHAAEKGLKLVTHIDDPIRNTYVIADPTRLMQIINNLIGNGLKFTREGSVTLSLRLINDGEKSSRIRFEVTDTGIGIDADKQHDIFEPFVQASTTTTREYGGTGLGLSIVKRLLALMQSEIHVESVKGIGSTFHFTVEFAKDTQVLQETQPQEEEYSLQGLRVLIAEDNPMNVLLMRKLFRRWQVEPVVAANGQEALHILQQENFDVILMDIHMPVMNGYEASMHIRAMDDRVKAQVPIIALTASVSQAISQRIREARMDDYVHKPFDPKDLYEKLNAIRKKMTIKN